MKLLVPRMEMVREADFEGRHAEGRAHLIAFCSGYMIDEHLAKRLTSSTRQT